MYFFSIKSPGLVGCQCRAKGESPREDRRARWYSESGAIARSAECGIITGIIGPLARELGIFSESAYESVRSTVMITGTRSACALFHNNKFLLVKEAVPSKRI
jgi:hypothetical protein